MRSFSANEEPDATAEFVRDLTNCQEELLVFIRAMCGDSHLAQDVRQAVNMVLWNKRRAFEPGTNFRGWAYRIAQLEVKAQLRRHSRTLASPLSPEVLEAMGAELPEVLDELPERRLALARCLEKLTSKDSQLISHRYWHGGSLEALATATDRSVGTLKGLRLQPMSWKTIRRGTGVVVNFSSGWGRSTSPEVAPYCATKWAIESALSQGAVAVALGRLLERRRPVPDRQPVLAQQPFSQPRHALQPLRRHAVGGPEQ